MNNRTDHAMIRAQQRGIRDVRIDLVIKYGTTEHVRGARSYWMDNAARRRAKNSSDGELYRKHADRLNFYVVVSHDECVITVAHRRPGGPNRRRKPRCYGQRL